MNSPFYEAEQKILYPHRIMIVAAAEQIAAHMRHLIKIEADTLENMRSTALGKLKHSYFVNASTDDIMGAFEILRK